jgi:tetratricopeptide (TPR) repeat protein
MVCACAFAFLLGLRQAPAADTPFYDQEPFDLVTMNDAGKTQLKVFPLEFPNRIVPENPKKSDKIRIRRLDDPDEEYDVAWSAIYEVKLFEQLVLDQANRLVAERKFNDAYDYFDFLRHEYPRVPGLEAGLCNYLYEEAGAFYREGKHENALSLLRTLYARQPERTGLEAAMANSTSRLVERYEKDKDFRSVRKLVSELKSCFPNGSSAKKFEQQLTAMAAELVAQGQRDLAAGKPRLALAAATRAWAIWPTGDGVRELAITAFEKYPQVTVGVTALSDGKGDTITDWASRRAHRLAERQLFEFTGYGANGGEYICPIGDYEITDLGRGLTINVRPNLPWSQGRPLTGYDVARRLIALAQPNHPDALHDWSLLCSSVAVRDVYGIEVRFRDSHLLPMALLAVPPTAGVESTADEPYSRAESTAEESSFEMRPDYFARQPQQPRGVVERRYASRSQALDALRKGEVSVVDRLAPSEVAELTEDKSIIVEPYDVPTMYCLIPNMARPTMRSRSLRRALVYAINRKQILEDQILKKQSLPGCMVTSGPFAKGVNLSDPQGYACNDDISPRPYEPRLAMSLASLAMKELAPKKKTDEKSPDGKPAAEAAPAGAPATDPAADANKKPPPLPPLVLVHPPEDLARVTCNAIVRNLSVIDLKVELRELPAGKRVPDDGNYDLAYVEYSLDEPLVEARRLFGDGALLGAPSAYMSLALRQVEGATGWNEARKALNDVHRIAYEEVCLVPLWQIVEHFAYRPNLKGVAKQPGRLYQQIEQWQTKDPLPPEDG